MGFIDWYNNWSAERRKKKELAALDRLRRFLAGEKRRIDPLEAVVGKIEVLVNQGKFEEAEKLAPDLIQMMKEKEIIDQMEKKDFKRFKSTMFKELRAEMKRIK